MVRIRIEVTAEDIAKGNPTICSSCPVALALRRIAADGFQSFGAVGTETFRVNLGSHLHLRLALKIKLPAKVRRFVYQFDNYGREAVSGFAFTIDLEDEFRSQIKPELIVS